MPAPAVSARAYVGAYVALVVLTFITCSLSFLRLSPWHLAVATTFAVIKGALIALFFMQLINSPARTRLAACIGIFWLGILIFLSMTDYLSRNLATY